MISTENFMTIMAALDSPTRLACVEQFTKAAEETIDHDLIEGQLLSTASMLARAVEQEFQGLSKQ